MRARSWMLVMISALAVPANARAQNVTPLPMGGRSGAMGGTAAAIGRDSAMGYLNPAGLAAVDKDTLSMSLSAYQLDALRIDAFFAAPNMFASGTQLDGNEMRQTTFRAIPTALSYILHLGAEGRHALAFSILNPRASKMELEGALHATTFATTFDDRASFVSDLSTLYVGPSYAVKIGGEGSALRIGASAFVAYSSLLATLSTETMAGLVPASEFAEQRMTRFTNGSSFELVGVAGVQAELGVFRFGASFHAPSLHISGDFENTGRVSNMANGVFDSTSNPSPDLLSQLAQSGSYEERLPWRALVGVGLELGDFTVAADASYVGPIGSYALFEGRSNDTQVMEGQTPVNTESAMNVQTSQNGVFGFSAGVEWRLSPAIALRAGGFTDFSATKMPEAPAPGDIFISSLDRFGGTLGLGFRTGAAETSVALTYVGGVGQVVGFDVGNLSAGASGARTVDAVSSRVALMLSGAVELEDILK